MAQHKLFVGTNERLVNALRELRRRGEVSEFHSRGDEDAIEVTTTTEHIEHVRQVANRYAE